MPHGPLPPVSSLGVLAVTTVLSCATAATSLSAPARVEPGTRGQLLYENHCLECHTTQAHWRASSKVSTRADLHRWIERWRDNLQLDWSADMVRDVADYLDGVYYRLVD